MATCCLFVVSRAIRRLKIEDSMKLVHFFPAMLVLAAACLAGCDSTASKSGEVKAAPAKVEMMPHETELATVTLTADATKRLGIATVAVEKRQVSRHRMFAGEAIVPSGRSIIAFAPVPGVIESAGAEFPQPGSQVAVAKPLMILKPLLSPERDVPTPAELVQMTGAKANLVSALVTAQGDVQRSESEIEGLRIARDRAQQLFTDRAGSRRALDDAVALLAIAESVLEASKQREKELASMLKSLEASNTGGKPEPASPLTLTAPVAGVVRSVSVSSGQTVTAGTPLFEVVDLSTIWVRVPVYVDLLSTLLRDKNATLVALDGGSLVKGELVTVTAKPIAAPPTADAATSSADLYYEVDNRTLGLRPGQRIGVDVPLSGITEAMVIPTASVLYDIYGGTWVYVQESLSESDSTKYVRQRVLLEWVDGKDAIVSQGPSVGANVVTDGAAELFGTEFGAGK